MCRRRASKLQRTAGVVIFYFGVYAFVSLALAPEPPVAFVGDDVRLGDKYALMYLARGAPPLFSDPEGADVFASRRCGRCFLTDNAGFLPLAGYDAVLVHGDRHLLEEAEAAMEPAKRYLIETSAACVGSKLRGCMREPNITSFATKKTYTLCSLCDELLRRKIDRKP